MEQIKELVNLLNTQYFPLVKQITSNVQSEDFDDETSDFTNKISRKLDMTFEDFPHDCLIYNEMMADIINGRAEGLDQADPTLLITLVINLLPIASTNH